MTCLYSKYVICINSYVSTYITMRSRSISVGNLMWFRSNIDIYHEIFNTLRKLNYSIIAPTKKGHTHVFSLVNSYEEVDLNYVRTSNTLRAFLEPEEVLYRWSLLNNGINIEENLPKDKLALFAIHPCDANSLVVLDALLGSEPQDPYYTIRRRNSIVIIDDCLGGDDYCKCNDLNARVPWLGSGDVWLVREDDSVFIAPISDVGTEFLSKYLSSYLTRTDSRPKIRNFIVGNARLVNKLYLLNYALNNPLWAQKSRECVFCGSCLAVCPTCVCFDIVDLPNDDFRSGVRVRRWNACLFRSFTAVAGGRVFRESCEERFKIKYYHKFLFIPRRYGVVGCVGCGRCTYFCPVGIDPIKLVKEVLGIA